MYLTKQQHSYPVSWVQNEPGADPEDGIHPQTPQEAPVPSFTTIAAPGTPWRARCCSICM